MPLPQGVFIRSPEPGTTSDRGDHPAVERGLRAAAAGRHRGRDRVRGHARRTAATPTSTSTTARPAAATPAGSTSRRPARPPSTTGPRAPRRRYKAPADRAQPAVQERADAEGRLHAEPGEGHETRRGRLGRPPLEQPDQVRRQLRTLGLRPHPRLPAGLPLRAAVPQGLDRRRRPRSRGLAAQRRSSPATPAPRTRSAGPTTRSTARGAARSASTYSGDSPSRSAASERTEPYYDKSLFSQPTGVGVEGFGNSGRAIVPPSDRVEHGHVAVQVVPGRAACAPSCGSRPRTCSTTPTGALRSRPSREQLPAVHAAQADSGTGSTQDRGTNTPGPGSSRSACVWSSDRPIRSGRLGSSAEPTDRSRPGRSQGAPARPVLRATPCLSGSGRPRGAYSGANDLDAEGPGGERQGGVVRGQTRRPFPSAHARRGAWRGAGHRGSPAALATGSQARARMGRCSNHQVHTPPAIRSRPPGARAASSVVSAPCRRNRSSDR